MNIGCDIVIREYESGDCAPAIALFYDTVHSVNAGDYSAEQLNAWADGCVDIDAWDTRFKNNYTLIAELNGALIGFGSITDYGYLDMLYISKNFQRKGIASALCDKLERNKPYERITADASITARPFFLMRGYIIIREQTVVRKGVNLKNYLMEKHFQVD